MKTSIKTLIIMVAALITLTATQTTNLRAAEINKTDFDQLPNFRKIVIKGNVEVVLVQRQTVGISYADDNAGDAKVTQKGEMLCISNRDNEKCKLIIFVHDIYRIEADENAVVKTEAKLSIKFLQIILKDNAFADINTSCEGLYTKILDSSTLKLKGNTNYHALVMGKAPNLTINGFVSAQTDVTQVETSEEEIAALVL